MKCFIPLKGVFHQTIHISNSTQPRLCSFRNISSKIKANNEDLTSNLTPFQKTLRVKSDESDMRLDRWLKKQYPLLTQSIIQRWLRTKKITLDEQKATAEVRVMAGQKVVVPVNLLESFNTTTKTRILNPEETEKVRSWVIYKDSEVIAINKPPGLACQGGSKLKEHVDYYLDHLQFDYPEKPRLVHRLDKDTSGVLILGRTRKATIKLQEAFKNHEKIQKTYWALVAGKPADESGAIRCVLEKTYVNGEEKVVLRDKIGGQAKKAITYFRTMMKLTNQWSLLAMFPLTGRTHQLRVTCSDVLKSPILGDTKYGIPTPQFDSVTPSSDRLYLHARRLSFVHPASGEKVHIEAPPPSHFVTFLNSFGMSIRDTINDDKYPDIAGIKQQKIAQQLEEARKLALKVQKLKKKHGRSFEKSKITTR